MSDLQHRPVAATPVTGAAPSGSALRIEVLLATYNNAPYLRLQLDSLLAQTWQDFHLVISDDCSTDDTVAILETYLDKFRNPVKLIRRDVQSGSAMANFASLMQASTGDWVFLCDADDIWHPEKLAKFLAFAREKHGSHPADVPLFLYSDARVIGSDGVLAHASYWAFKRTDPARCATLQRLLVCAPMLGCASMMNKALVRHAANVPVGQVTGHDWWALLVAASLGTVDFMPEPTIDYRVHPGNSSKPMQVSLRLIGRVGMKLSLAHHEVHRRMVIRQKQAEPLLAQFDAELPPERRAIIKRFLRMSGQSPIGRKLTMLWHGYTYPDYIRNSALVLFY
jgi:glycosyltransferase involved in cell wall biosynthesis